MSDIKYPVDKITAENREEVLKKLEEYFEPSEVSFKPQAINYRTKTAMAAAYADTRVYYDRLNKVVGRWNWSVEITGMYCTEYQKLVKGKKAYGSNPATEDKLIPGNKVGCTVVVRIEGLGSVCDTGEKDASDENAFTSAFAQAVKRAISTFGPGKYFYELGAMEFPYEPDTRKWVVEPSLPSKFVPTQKCDDCNKDITATTITLNNTVKELTVHEVISNSKQKYNANLCVACQKKRHLASVSQESHTKASKS